MAQEILPSGTLVRIRPDPLQGSGAPFATTGRSGKGLVLYERIDLESYPSCNDFFGNTVNVEPGTCGIVVSHVGYPFKINAPEKWDFNVYTILVGAAHVQVFGCDLTEVDHPQGGPYAEI